MIAQRQQRVRRLQQSERKIGAAEHPPDRSTGRRHDIGNRTKRARACVTSLVHLPSRAKQAAISSRHGRLNSRRKPSIRNPSDEHGPTPASTGTREECMCLACLGFGVSSAADRIGKISRRDVMLRASALGLVLPFAGPALRTAQAAEQGGPAPADLVSGIKEIIAKASSPELVARLSRSTAAICHGPISGSTRRRASR
ncbi:hypothetical protein HU675_0022170 [Bradyrhizobium septentrionale]|uniref:hypothetical protein n=1 Tax=Bradyrhizobium septentrionale TaxID=1404411 RepID=UPI001CD7FEFA|nr:hypothetical protein [Bradyrhizobium septentrionale]UGY29936.1 hypothetical protein HU675_0022170 [Bradyrhizobium septentrionale]